MIITIISPIRFKREIMEKYVELSLKGYIVLLPVDTTTIYSKQTTTTENVLMKLHKEKIMLADMILVLNVNGYMGRGTYEEIGYAIVHGKKIEYLEPLKEVE